MDLHELFDNCGNKNSENNHPNGHKTGCSTNQFYEIINSIVFLSENSVPVKEMNIIAIRKYIAS